MKDQEVIHIYLVTQAALCFRLIYNRYAAKIYSKCLSILKNEAQAQDATQEIFTKIFMNLSKFGEKSKFSTWIYSITYNYCIDYIRRKKKQKNLFSDEMEKAPDIIDEVPDHELLQMEVKKLKTVLQRIPEGDKMILMMKYRDEMSIKEIASTLGKSESAVKMKIKRAKAKAQKLKLQL